MKSCQAFEDSYHIKPTSALFLTAKINELYPGYFFVARGKTIWAFYLFIYFWEIFCNQLACWEMGVDKTVKPYLRRLQLTH